MKRMTSFFLVLVFALLVPATSSLARYYSSHYYGGYSGRYYPYHHGHSYHSHDSLAFLGVGLLTGAVIGSLLYQPPVERTVVYATPPPPVYVAPPPPTIIQRSPVIITPQPEYYPDNEVLRLIKPTVRTLNLRSGPGLDEDIIGQAAFEEVLGVIGAAPDWLYVKTQDGQYGWVMTQYTQALEPAG